MIDTGAWVPTGYDHVVAFELSKYVRKRNAAADADALKARADAQKQQLNGKAVLDVRRELQIPPDEVPLLEQLAAHSIDAALVTESGKWPVLGPRSGISDAARLLRGVKLNILSLDQLASGEAAALAIEASASARAKPAITSRTSGAEGGKGVKRGGHELTVQGKCEEKRAEKQQQRAARVAAPPIEYKYKTKCDKCNAVLNSQLQFGLECECEDFMFWSACERCMLPMKGEKRGLCGDCAGA